MDIRRFSHELHSRVVELELAVDAALIFFLEPSFGIPANTMEPSFCQNEEGCCSFRVCLSSVADSRGINEICNICN